jgi:hypothetical protein
MRQADRMMRQAGAAAATVEQAYMAGAEEARQAAAQAPGRRAHASAEGGDGRWGADGLTGSMQAAEDRRGRSALELDASSRDAAAARARTGHREGAGPVRALPGRLSALSVSQSKSFLYDAFVWVCRALNSPKRWFPAPRAAACLVLYLVTIVKGY